MKIKHTATPWNYQENSDAYTHIIRGLNNEFIIQFSQDTSGKSEANARFIVRACNSYYANHQDATRIRELEGALRKIVEEDNSINHITISYLNIIRIAKAALTKSALPQKEEK